MLILRPLVVTHERRGHWSAQLRGRLGDRPVRWRETRGAADLLAAVAEVPCPIVILDLAPRPLEVLDRLARVAVAAADPLVLAIDGEGRDDLRRAARECGATYVWSGFAPPPPVADLIDRWIALARRRLIEAGPAASPAPEGDPLDPLALIGL